MTALFSAVWTGLCAAATLVEWQASSGESDAYRLSSIIEAVKSNHNSIYVTASADTVETELTIQQGIVHWLLEIPAIIPLLVVAAMLLAFYRWLAVIEKEASQN